MTISAARSGYRFDFGAVQFFIGDDGRFYPTVPGRDTSLKRVSANHWIRIHRADGIALDKSLLVLSSDQRTMSISTRLLSPPGQNALITETLRRLKPGRELAGVWQSNLLGADADQSFEIGNLGGGNFQWGSRDGNYYVAKLDGIPAPNVGPMSVSGVRLALRQLSPHELRWTETIKGRPYRLGVDVLLPDGLSFKETRWPAQFPASKETLLYRRTTTTPVDGFPSCP